MLIELSTACNVVCKNCPKHVEPLKRPEKHMEFEVFTKAINECTDKHIYLSGYGSSFLNPNIEKVISYTYDWGIYTIIPTNITELKSLKNWEILRKVNELHLSLDSLYDNQWKGCSIKECLEIIEKLHSMNMNNLSINMVLREETWGEIIDFISYFPIYRHIPLRLTFESPSYTCNSDQLKRYKWLMDHYYELRRLITTFGLPITIDTGCSKFATCSFRKNKEVVLDWRGKRYPCTNAFFSEYEFDDEELEKVYQGNHLVCDNCRKMDELWKGTPLGTRPD